MLTIPCTAGWLAQGRVLLNDQDQKIARPRQVYDGVWLRDSVSIEQSD